MFLQKLMQLCTDVKGTFLPVIIYAISKKKNSWWTRLCGSASDNSNLNVGWRKNVTGSQYAGKEKICRVTDSRLAVGCHSRLCWLFAVFLWIIWSFAPWSQASAPLHARQMPHLWVPTGVMSKMNVELLRSVKTEKLLGTAENTTGISSGTLVFEAVVPADFQVPLDFMKRWGEISGLMSGW